jgi:hypothetical protein
MDQRLNRLARRQAKGHREGVWSNNSALASAGASPID